MKKRLFIQNDGMYLHHENKEAWFVGRNNNVLYKLNLESMELQYEYNLNSDEENPYRRTPLCYKKNQTIVIFPDKGKNILFYDVEKKIINKYKVNAENNIGIGIYCFGEWNDLLWAVSYWMKEIFLIDVKLRKIVKRYRLFRTDEHIEISFESILVGENIFCVSRNANFVSKTNIVSGVEKVYELSVKDRGFNTIHFDGERFCLSSMKGNIYIWDAGNNEIEQIFAKNGTRYRSISVGDTVCFLPFNLDGDLCDELLCCDIKGKRCFSFAISGKTIKGIYAFEYVRDNRIIGISHSGNNFITEINVENGERKTVCMNASDHFLGERMIREGKVLYESNECDISFYLGLI